MYLMKPLLAALFGFVLLTMTVLPAQAAPENGHWAVEISIDCDGLGQVPVLLQFDPSGAALFDVAQGNGRQYVQTYYDVRIYSGVHQVEPASDPVFAAEKEYGNRYGFSEFLDCSGSPVLTFPGVAGYFTAFFEVGLATK